MEAGEKQLNSLRFGEFLTAQYELLRRVFYSLSVSDLQTCMEVSLAWKQAALRTIKERRSIQCLFIEHPDAKPFIISDAALSITFACEYEKYSSIPSHIGTGSSPDVPDLFKDDQDLNIMADETLQVLSRFGVVGGFRYSEAPLVEQLPRKALVRFPEWDGAHVKTFTITLTKLTEQEMEAVIDLPDDFQLQAVIIISSGSHWDTHENIYTLLDCLRRKRKEFPLGGCRLELDGKAFIQCLLFFGPNVESASCIVTCDEIDGTIENLSKSVIHTKNSVLLAFRDFKRRLKPGPKESIETSEINAIKKFFPITPSIGCFAAMQYGSYCPWTPRYHRCINYGLTTVLVYIGFKK